MISWSEALLELSKCPGKRRRKNLTLRTGQRSERQRKTETWKSMKVRRQEKRTTGKGEGRKDNQENWKRAEWKKRKKWHAGSENELYRSEQRKGGVSEVKESLTGPQVSPKGFVHSVSTGWWWISTGQGCMRKGKQFKGLCIDSARATCELLVALEEKKGGILVLT